VSRLDGKVAVVTGGSRGAGRAIVQRLGREGARVVSVSRSRHDHQDDAVFEVTADISTPDGAQHVCDTAHEHFGRLDVLVNNAAVIFDGSVEETDVEVWDEVMAVNARGPFLCAKYAIPYLREAGGGAIVNISSINAEWAQPNLAAYCASKGAVLALTRAIAIDHAHEGIRATCVCPSYIRTEMLERYYGDQDDPALARRAGAAMHPIGRVAEPEEIAALVAWLASDDAMYVTGHPILIDGGLLAGQARLRSSEAHGRGGFR
jgi:meso-butanediol dehydrogenase/(S,S)-butanediol dehydrogenase/diacetyl reductase